MRVLITGITGFVGSHLADYILENHPQVEVAGLVRWRSPKDHIESIMDRITLQRKKLKALGWKESAIEGLEMDIDDKIGKSLVKAQQADFCCVSGLYEGVFA